METTRPTAPFSRLAAAGALLALGLLAPGAVRADFFTVDNTNNSGAGSLRQAILNANADVTPPHTIDFDIPGVGPFTITPLTALPPITRQTNLTGFDEAISGAPGIRVDGTGLGAGVDGIVFAATADGSSVSYLSITGFPDNGIVIASDSTGVYNCHVGVAPDGITDGGNGSAGVYVTGVATTIGSGSSTRNVISGNGGDGIAFVTGSGFSLVRGNRIGTYADGASSLPNGGDGIEVSGTSSGGTIGGNGADLGNQISGNSGAGVQLGDSTSFWGVQGNLIGTRDTGDAALPNGASGVVAAGSDHLLGSTNPLGRNVISGNIGYGIALNGTSDGIEIHGNFIGTNAAGTASVGTQAMGIRVTGTVTNCTIGGTGPTFRNLISGNSGWGVSLESGVTGCVVSGNYVGTNAAGTAAIANGVGVEIGGSSNAVGGDSAGERNVLSGNTGSGAILHGASNKIQGNYIGTNAAGSAALANGSIGLQVYGATGGTIGGTNAGEGNVISGNNYTGLTFDGLSSGVTIAGNTIGLDAAGTMALPNLGGGITLAGSGMILGGSTAAARNVISGNVSGGIGIYGTNHLVRGNFVGTNPAGTAAVPNGGDGIRAFDGSGTQIGGPGAGDGNLISGNSGSGVVFDAATSGYFVRGNLIGTSAAGTSAIANAGGITLGGTGHTVGGSTAETRNVISGNTFGGIGVYGSDHVISGNYIGTNALGTAAIAGSGSNGIRILAADNITIGGIGVGEGNVISGHADSGIAFDGTSANCFVLGNRIGTNAAGIAAIANAAGIGLAGSGHTVGGATAGARNLLSGNTNLGLFVSGSYHAVSGNYIGTNAAGTAALGNGGYGVRSDAVSYTLYGGDTVAEGNVIAGNPRGVSFGFGSHDNAVLNNIIGLDATAAVDLADNGTGIEIGDSYDNTIGLPGAGNVIAGMSYHGITISGPQSTGNLILGNWIGTNKVAASTLGNDFAGIFVTDSSGNTIGGTGAGAGNVIAYNTQVGVWVERGEENEISGNSIFGNYFGIDIDALGFFPNDGGDGDDGANRRQNYPLISSAVVNGGATDVDGLLINEPNTEYRVEFFSSPTCGAAGFGQGKTFRGSTLVTTNGGGQATLATSIPLAIADDFLTATVTDPLGNSSEFSPCAQVDLGESPGKFQFDRTAYVGYEGVIPTTQVFVTRSHGMSGTATVAFATSNSSALAGSDYTDSDQTLTFAPWEVIKIVEVPILYDPAPETVPAPEKLLLALSSPSAGASLGSPSAAEIQVWDYTDDDPGLTVGDSFIDEGSSGQKMLTFPVKLTATDHEVKVTYLTEPGSATEAVDYTHVLDEITFPPSASTQTYQVQVPVLGDTDVETDEIVWLRVTTAPNGGNWIAYDGFGRGEIRNDDFDDQDPPLPNAIFADSFEIGTAALWTGMVTP